MNQQQRKNYLLRRYMQKRDIEQLRQRQNEMKNQPTFGDKLVGGLNQVKSTYEDLNGINKAKTAWDAFRAPKMPSADFVSKVGATEGLKNVGQGLNVTKDVANMGNYGLNTANTASNLANTGELASKIGAGSEIAKSAGVVGNTASTAGNTASAVGNAGGAMSGALQGVGKAMPVVGTVAGIASAGNNFAKGNHIDGAMDLAKTGAMFIPGVGWAVAGAIQIAQMLKGIFDKKRAKAKAKSQKMAQEEMQNSLEGMQENKQDILNAKTDNAQAMAEQLQKNNADTATATGSDVIDPTGINTPTEQQTPLHGVDAGVKGFYSPEESQWLAKQQGMPTGMAVNLPQQPLPVDGSASQYNGQEEAYNQAVANMQQPPVPPTPQVPAEPSVTQAPTTPDVQAPEGQGGLLEGAKGIWDILQNKLGKVPENLSSGLTDFAEGYKDNTQTSFTQGDLAKMVQQPKEVTPSKTEDGTITGGVEEKKKSIMNRLGELAGTGQRIASHPLTQAGIAGLVSKMAGGEVDDIAKAMYEYGTKKAESDRYYQMATGKTDRPFLNTYGADDYKTQVQKDNWQKEFDWKVAKDQRDYELDKQKTEAMAKYYANGGMRGNSADRLAWEMQKYKNNQVQKLLEAQHEQDLANAENLTYWGEEKTGKKNIWGKDKTRKLTKEEYIQKLNNQYYKDLQAMINGNYTSPTTTPYTVDEDGFYNY